MRRHDLIAYPQYLRCVNCHKMFRDEDDAAGARCRPRKDRKIHPWQDKHYWSDMRARQQRRK